MPRAHRLGSLAAGARLVALVASLCVVAVVLGACGNAGGAGSGNTSGGIADGSGPTGSAVPPAGPSGGRTPAPLPEPPGSTGIPTPPVSEPVSGQRLRAVPWRLVSSTGSELVVETTVGGYPCDRVTGLDVAETASNVTVTVWAGPQDGATGCDGPQPAIAQIVWLRARLAAPLGQRTLLPKT